MLIPKEDPREVSESLGGKGEEKMFREWPKVGQTVKKWTS